MYALLQYSSLSNVVQAQALKRQKMLNANTGTHALSHLNLFSSSFKCITQRMCFTIRILQFIVIFAVLVLWVVHHQCHVFGRPFVKRFALCYRIVVLSVLSETLVYCGQTVGWIKMLLGTEAGLGPGDTALHGDQAPPQ